MKLMNCFRRIPMPVRACFWAVAALLMAVVYYIVLGCPTLTLKQEFRRAEKVHMVGPSKIVDQVPMPEYSEFETMLVGETDHGITFFGRYGTSRSGGKFSGERHYRFSYQEKTGDVTFVAPPNVFGVTGLYELPVYIFTEYKEAVRASVSITVAGSRSYTHNDGTKVEDPFNETFQAENERDENGFFRFYLTARATENSAADPFGQANDSAYALFCLSNLCSDNAFYDNQRTMVIPIQVRLFDAAGNEILTKDICLGPHEQPKPET